MKMYKWVEIVSKVIGYLNAAGSGLSILLFFICSFLVPRLTAIILERLEPYERDQARFKVEPALWKMIIVGICFSIITLFFSLLLLNGIYKRKPGHILSYIVFSVVVIVINIITYIVISVKNTSSVLWGLFHTVIFSILLCIVWLEYRKIKLEKTIPPKNLKLESEI